MKYLCAESVCEYHQNTSIIHCCKNCSFYPDCRIMCEKTNKECESRIPEDKEVKENK